MKIICSSDGDGHRRSSSFGFSDPWFVVPWYGVGLLNAVGVLYDTLYANTEVNKALKAAWPLIVFFFSVIGLALYWWTCRPPNIGAESGEAEERIHGEYVDDTMKKVTGSVIHCVGGDGLGIVTAMAAMRLVNANLWTEFWVEYLVGFLFGWILFQTPAMMNTGDNDLLEALWKGGRAEFFSMITVMLGMGLVMRYVAPILSRGNGTVSVCRNCPPRV